MWSLRATSCVRKLTPSPPRSNYASFFAEIRDGIDKGLVFLSCALTRGDFKTSPGRYAGQDNGWIGLYINPVTDAFWEE